MAAVKGSKGALHATWFKKLENWKADQLVFINELSINIKLSQSTHGYAKKGRIRFQVPSKKAENLSLLPVLSVNGYITCNVYKGGVSAEMYKEFIHDFVLTKCNPWPGPCSVIITDNARIHQSEVQSIFNNISLLIFRLLKH